MDYSRYINSNDSVGRIESLQANKNKRFWNFQTPKYDKEVYNDY